MFLVLYAPVIEAFRAHDPDDFTRLLQVRAWLDGQGWFDTRQYRFNPPRGGDIHWVRLGDLPLAAVLWPLRHVLADPAASVAAMTITPLLQLLVALILLNAITLELGASDRQRLLSLAIFPLMPLLEANFTPMRVDYHGWQAVLGLAVSWLMVRDKRWDSALAGLLMAVWLTLSLEAIAFAALLCTWLSLGFLRERSRRLEFFLGGLALGSVLLTLAFRTPATFFSPYCDVLSWPHTSAFCLIAIVAPCGRMAIGDGTLTRRLLSLTPLPILAGVAIGLPLGECAVKPLAFVDPLANNTFFDLFNEAAPIWRQPASVVSMTLWTGVVIAAGWNAIERDEGQSHVLHRWRQLAVLAGAAFIVSLLVERAGVVAQILAIPFSGLLVTRYLPSARALTNTLPRVVATVLCFVVATPTLATGVAKSLDRPQIFERDAKPFLHSKRRCDYSRLAHLQSGLVFSGIGVAPEIVAKTPLDVVASTYHRDGAQIADVVRGFAGPVGRAEAILHAHRARYVAVCLSDLEIAYFASKRPDNLARMLINSRHPDWLKPVEGFSKGALRVYRLGA